MKMPPLLIVWLIASGLAAALPVFAAEPSSHHPSPLAGVAALDRLVTYTETKIPLGELIQKVAADTGVPLAAATDVADEPVAVVVKQMPARELLEQLADLLDFQWAQRPGHRAPNTEYPTPTLEIYQDLASKRREKALRAAAFDGEERQLREEIRRWAEMARLSEAQIRAMKDTAEQQLEAIATLPWEQQRALLRSPERWKWIEQDQRAKVLSRPIVRTLADLAGGLTPGQWGLLRARHRLVLSSHPDGGELPLPARFGHLFRASRYQGSTDRVDGPSEMLRQMNGQLRNMQAEWARAAGYHVILQYDPSGFATGKGLYLDATAIPSPSPRASLFESGNRFVVGRPGELDWLPSAQAPREPPPAEAADPVLGRTAAFVPHVEPRRDAIWPSNGPLWQIWDLLPEIARAYHVQAISDAYWSTGAVYGLQFPAGERALSEQLAAASGGYYRWDRQGALIRLRSKNWFLDRRREIPLRLVRGWQRSFAQYGEPTFDQYVEAAAALTDLQLQSTTRLLHRGVLPARAFSLEIAYDARWALRFYASLAPAQHQAIREGKQVAGSRWSPRQRALFEAALAEAPPSGSGPKRTVPVRWEKAAVSMSSTAMIEYTDKRNGGQASGTRLASPARPGLWKRPPLPSHRAASPSVSAATPHRSVISDEGGTETRGFTWVKLYLTGGPGLRQEYYLYYTATVP